jgi:uncharacterized protein YxeA
MKRILFIVTSLLICVVIQAQTFVCTDIDYRGSDLTPQKVQKEKAKYLGSKATLTFYDKSLKFSYTINGKTESLVLDKVNANEYQAIEKRGNNTNKLVLKLNTWIEYIRSFTLESYKNYSLEATATYKRD